MKKRDKIIIAVSLSFIAVLFILAAPWLLVLIIPGAIGIGYGIISDRLKQSKSTPQDCIDSETASANVNINIQVNDSAYLVAAASAHALEARGDMEKLNLLEQQLPAFRSFVSSCMERDGELPPFVPVRDTLPELYMRYGMWEKAEGVIHLCTMNSDYGYNEYRNEHDHTGHWVSKPEQGEEALKSMHLRRTAAESTLTYLSNNPGTLQSKIYRVPILASVDHDSLVWFCKNSHQIRKEKDGKSNRLFIASEVSL